MRHLRQSILAAFVTVTVAAPSSFAQTSPAPTSPSSQSTTAKRPTKDELRNHAEEARKKLIEVRKKKSQANASGSWLKPISDPNVPYYLQREVTIEEAEENFTNALKAAVDGKAMSKTEMATLRATLHPQGKPDAATREIATESNLHQATQAMSSLTQSRGPGPEAHNANTPSITDDSSANLTKWGYLLADSPNLKRDKVSDTKTDATQ